MVWYIGKISFKAKSLLADLEENVLQGERVREEICDPNIDLLVRFVEGANSSFLRGSEDYILSVEGDKDTDSDNNYQYNLSIGSTSPDVKRKVMERTKRYLSINNIKFDEENL